jgi:hypothetical protein
MLAAAAAMLQRIEVGHSKPMIGMWTCCTCSVVKCSSVHHAHVGTGIGCHAELGLSNATAAAWFSKTALLQTPLRSLPIMMVNISILPSRLGQLWLFVTVYKTTPKNSQLKSLATEKHHHCKMCMAQ